MDGTESILIACILGVALCGVAATRIEATIEHALAGVWAILTAATIVLVIVAVGVWGSV